MEIKKFSSFCFLLSIGLLRGGFFFGCTVFYVFVVIGGERFRVLYGIRYYCLCLYDVD